MVAAGSVLRGDVPDGQLTIVAPPASKQAPINTGSYRDVSPAVAKNAIYIANLRALQEWYQRARSPFFAAQEFGELVYEGALEMLAAAMSERSKRLQAMVANVSPGQVSPDQAGQSRLREHIGDLCRILLADPLATVPPEELLTELAQQADTGSPYINAVQRLSAQNVATATAWLGEIIQELWTRSVDLVPSLAGSSRP